jgi:hypothetical protein
VSNYNAYVAEQEYGKAVMDKYRRRDDRVNEPAPAYSVQKRRKLALPLEDRSRNQSMPTATPM